MRCHGQRCGEDFVAVADVDALVKKNSAIDQHAHTNTTSVYTSARVFSMLPERLSTDLTSLNPGEDRLTIVTEMVVDAEGPRCPPIPRCTVPAVRNHAKLAYDAVAAWIEGEGDLPEAARAVPGMDEQLRTQDAVAQRMRAPAAPAGLLPGDLSAARRVRRRPCGGHPPAGAKPGAPAD